MPFNEKMLGNNEIESYKSMNLSELQILIDKNEKNISDFEDKIEEKLLKISFDERQAKKQEIIATFIDQLIQEKNRFKFVFQTLDQTIPDHVVKYADKIGSYYFILNSGESFRIKWSVDGYKIMPVYGKIFFVDEKTLDKILEIDNRQFNLINYSIKKSPIAKNTTPIEINNIYLPVEALFSEDENEITILGTHFKEGDISKKLEEQISSGLHIGHPINNIIKK